MSDSCMNIDFPMNCIFLSLSIWMFLIFFGSSLSLPSGFIALLLSYLFGAYVYIKMAHRIKEMMKTNKHKKRKKSEHNRTLAWAIRFGFLLFPSLNWKLACCIFVRFYFSSRPVSPDSTLCAVAERISVAKSFDSTKIICFLSIELSIRFILIRHWYADHPMCQGFPIRYYAKKHFIQLSMHKWHNRRISTQTQFIILYYRVCCICNLLHVWAGFGPFYGLISTDACTQCIWHFIRFWPKNFTIAQWNVVTGTATQPKCITTGRNKSITIFSNAKIS